VVSIAYLCADFIAYEHECPIFGGIVLRMRDKQLRCNLSAPFPVCEISRCLRTVRPLCEVNANPFGVCIHLPRVSFLFDACVLARGVCFAAKGCDIISCLAGFVPFFMQMAEARSSFRTVVCFFFGTRSLRPDFFNAGSFLHSPSHSSIIFCDHYQAVFFCLFID
jgi:hypothetical protein